MCLLDTNVVIYGQFTWGVFDLKAKLVEQKQYEGEGEILRWIFVRMKLLVFKIQFLSAWRRLTPWTATPWWHGVAAKRIPTWFNIEIYSTNLHLFAAGLVNGERWRAGSNVERSQCGDDECEADSRLPLWHRRKLHRGHVQVETYLDLFEETLIWALFQIWRWCLGEGAYFWREQGEGFDVGSLHQVS